MQNVFLEVQTISVSSLGRLLVCQVGICTEGKTFCTIACLRLFYKIEITGFVRLLVWFFPTSVFGVGLSFSDCTFS